jgi:flagellar biosynthetic protein FliR
MTGTIASSLLVTFLLATVRAAAFLTIAPPFATKAVPPTVKALLAAAMALLVTPRAVGRPPSLETGALLTALAEQVLVGAALGFLTALVFAAVQSAGDLIDLFGGFSLAFAFDPLMQTGNSVFGKLYGQLATTLLFISGGHLLMLRGFLATYRAVPLDAALSLGSLDDLLTTGLARLFVAALQIAGPLIAVLFLADVALGLLTKVAPALNAFSLGFPAKMLLTIIVVGMALPAFPGLVDGLTDQMVGTISAVTGR